MVTLINNLPDNILGIATDVQITDADLKTILMPAAELKLKSNKKIRLLYLPGFDFTGLEQKALQDDNRLGEPFFPLWERVALVSDQEMIYTLAKSFGNMNSEDVRVFKNSELEMAKNWIIAEEISTKEENKTWLEKLIVNTDTEFPLSGGETDRDLEQAII